MKTLERKIDLLIGFWWKNVKIGEGQNLPNALYVSISVVFAICKANTHLMENGCQNESKNDGQICVFRFKVVHF